MATGASGKDVEAVYRMLYPKPKPLLQYCKELVRHGELIYYSPNTNSTKPRYFFLFDTALLLTKRTGKKRYWLKIYVHLRHGVTLVDNGPTDTQFRLMVTVKGRSRPIIMYGKNQQHKDLWVRDLKQVLWAANGRKGTDPSLTDSTSPVASRRGGQQLQQPQQAAGRSGKEAKPQRDGFDASGSRNTRFGDDDDDDFGNPSDDSGDDDEEEAEVEFMNVKDKSGPSGVTIAHRQEEVDRLTHGLDSLVFDPFSDFIPPTSAAAAPSSHAPSTAYPATPLAYFSPPLASSGVPYGTVATPFGPTGVPPPQHTAFTPFGPVLPLAHPGAPPVYGNPFVPTGTPVMVPPTQQAQLLYQQQLHLQQQMQQLAAIQQHYQSSGVASPSAPEDPFIALAYRG